MIIQLLRHTASAGAKLSSHIVIQQPLLNKAASGPDPSGFIDRLVLLFGVRHEACVWYRNDSGSTCNSPRTLVLLTVVLLSGGYCSMDTILLLYSIHCHNMKTTAVSMVTAWILVIHSIHSNYISTILH